MWALAFARLPTPNALYTALVLNSFYPLLSSWHACCCPITSLFNLQACAPGQAGPICNAIWQITVHKTNLPHTVQWTLNGGPVGLHGWQHLGSMQFGWLAACLAKVHLASRPPGPRPVYHYKIISCGGKGETTGMLGGPQVSARLP